MKVKKVKLSVSPRHPARKFRIGKHVVQGKPELYELDEAEQEELKSKGCQKWLRVHEAGKEAKPLTAEKTLEKMEEEAPAEKE